MNTKCFPALLLFAVTAIAGAGDPPSKFKVTTKKSDDTAEVRADKDKAMFAVKSPFGISEAVIERLDDAWPKAVMLRLHLKGLESLRVANRKMKLDASAGIQDGKLKVRQWKDGKEDVSIDDKNPLWMEIRILGADGKAAKELPLKDGYFEVSIPRAFFEGNPKAITVSWIDFYRN